jgi:hypothetical protein
MTRCRNPATGGVCAPSELVAPVGGWLGKIIHVILLKLQRLHAGLAEKLALTPTGC